MEIRVPDAPNKIVNTASSDGILPRNIIPDHFTQWRGRNLEQKKAVRKVLTHYFKSDKPFLFIQAPTGSGKSLIAIASAILVRNYAVKLQESASSEKPPAPPYVLILSENTFLIEQYGRDFKVPTLNGRKNYECPYLKSQGKTGTVEDCPFINSGGSYTDCPLMKAFFGVDSDKKSPQRPDLLADSDEKSEKAAMSLAKIPPEFVGAIPCPYLRARELARRGGIAVMNYHYAYVVYTLRERYEGLSKLWAEPSLVIVDEAHKFPEFLMNVFEESINLDRLLKTFQHYLTDKDLAKTKKSISALFDVINTFLKNEWALEIYFRDETLLSHYDKMISSFRELNKYSPEKLRNFLDEYRPHVPPNGENYAIPLTVAEEVVSTIEPFVSNLYELIVNIQNFTWKTLDGIENYITLHGSGNPKAKEALAFIKTAKKTLNSNSYAALREILDDEASWDTLNELLFTVTLSKNAKDPTIANEVVDVIYYAYEIFASMFYDFLRSGSPTNIKQAYLFLQQFKENKDYIVRDPNDELALMDKTKDTMVTLTLNSKGELMLNLKLIFPQRVFDRFWELLGRPKMVFMSATLIESLIVEMLGLTKDQYDFFRIPSEFKAENRPIFYTPLDYISRKNLQDKNFLIHYIHLIDQILMKFPKDRGILLVPSMRDMHLLKQYSKHSKRLIFVKGGVLDKMKALNLLKGTTNGVLVGPSVWEGVDLKGDLSRFQVIFKIPFASLGDSVVKARMKRSPTWYKASALLKTIQGCGRSVRSRSDYAVTVIMDKSFGSLLKEFYDETPDWFLEAVLVYWPSKKDFVSLKSLDWLFKKKKTFWILFSTKHFNEAFALLLKKIDEFKTLTGPDEASPSANNSTDEEGALSTPQSCT